MANQIFQETLPPTAASTTPSTHGVSWLNPTNITVNDGSYSALIFTVANDTNGILKGSSFDFRTLPDSAVIDGLAVTIDGFNEDCSGTVALNIAGTSTKSASDLNRAYGGLDDFWGLTAFTAADIAALEVTVNMADTGTGMGFSSIDYMTVTVFWHLDLNQTTSPTLPTVFSYKAYSKDGTYLGELPNVTSPFSFAQDINSAGAVLKTTCGVSPKPTVTLSPILDDAGDPLETESSLEILASLTNTPVLPGASDDDALFKNGNRLEVWMFSKWRPNGILIFSGQMNRIDFEIGGAEQISVTTYSDGIDLDNYLARGYPFTYSTDQQQTTQNSSATISTEPISLPGWVWYGQSITSGVTAPNMGEIQLLLSGSATVTVRLLDGPDGNFIASITKSVAAASFSTPTQFEFSSLIPTSSLTPYFFQISVDRGESIDIGTNSAGGYAGGTAYQSIHSSGGTDGAFVPVSYDLWFKTGIGALTTTTTYSSQDPVTGMAAGILADYNSRGGRITARDLVAAGYNLTYLFNSATILSAIKKILELSPSGYYSYTDLGTSEIDILPTSTDADFIVVIGKDISSLNFSMTIENIKNQLFFSGGDIGGGVNLFKQYQDTESTQDFDPRLAQQSDNRITLDDTADALGTSFIEENSGEVNETSVVLLHDAVDITLYVPGKTLGFSNTGMFADDLVLQIVRREFFRDFVRLTIGRLPVTESAKVEAIKRGLQDQQTIANPSEPS